MAQELQVRGGDFDAISHLLELLFEVQGRSYGIPQLLDASDHLSEVYIDRVERHLLRKGIPTWRFNDDFRMACRTYSEALDSIEQLDAAARASGLVISESKTLTFGFMKYMIDSSILEPQLGQKAMNVDDVEAAVGDYTDDFSGDTDPAKAAIKSAQATGGEDASMDLRKTTVEDGRILRRAFNALIAATDPDVVEDILRLFIYVPALSPTLCKYLASVYSVAQDRVSTALDDIIGQVSMNEWQRQWVIHVIYQLKLLGSQAPGDVGSRITWVESARLESPSQVTVAIATLALAAERSIDFNTVMQEFETSPLALLNWYATALREYRDTSPDSGLDKRLEAVAKTSPLHHALVTFDAS